MDLLPAARVLVIILGSHTTQFAQLLDPIFFGIFKPEKKHHLQCGNLAAMTSFVDNVAVIMKMTTRLPLSKTAAGLQAIVVEFDMIITPYHAIFHEGKLKGSQQFGELWIRDALLESLRSGQ
jgi:hypothetical protein